jgi:hypothetical protein
MLNKAAKQKNLFQKAFQPVMKGQAPPITVMVNGFA